MRSGSGTFHGATKVASPEQVAVASAAPGHLTDDLAERFTPVGRDSVRSVVPRPLLLVDRQAECVCKRLDHRTSGRDLPEGCAAVLALRSRFAPQRLVTTTAPLAAKSSGG